MSEHDDRVFAERLAEFAASADEADWDDVVRRARHKGRAPIVAVVVASLLAVAVASPAFGLQRIVIDWFTTEPASPRTEVAFSTLDKGAPPGLETRVIPGTAGKYSTSCSLRECERESGLHPLRAPGSASCSTSSTPTGAVEVRSGLAAMTAGTPPDMDWRFRDRSARRA